MRRISRFMILASCLNGGLTFAQKQAAGSQGAQCLRIQNSLDGFYEMDLKIGEKTFKDLMCLQGVDQPISFSNYAGGVKGHIEVPGVFTSNLTGSYRCKLWSSMCSIQFSILAKENGQEFEVFYEAKYFVDFANPSGSPVLTGSAYLKGRKLLGEFSAKLKEEKNGFVQ